jgi:hypothetical protein
MMTLLAEYEYGGWVLSYRQGLAAASERGDPCDFLRSPCGVAD